MIGAHGLGEPIDLTIPYTYALVGGAWALTMSFTVVALAWREPRYGLLEPGEPPPRRPWLAVAGLALSAWFVGALFLQPADDNGGIGALYVLVWVGLVPLALLAGHVWRDLSPWRSLQWALGRLTGRPEGFAAYPEKLGLWPAALGLFAFAWLELASANPESLDAVRLWVVLYGAAMLVGGAVFGPTWFDRADPFDVYSSLVARLSPFVRDGRLGLFDPLRTLAATPVRPGLVAVVAVLLGSTAFDGFSASGAGPAGPGGRSLVLLLFVAVVGTLFVLATVASGGDVERRKLPGLMAPSLIPIVLGYVVAHYATFLVERGPLVVGQLLGQDWEATHALTSHPALLGTLKVGAVVVGHMVAVVVAHDRALAVLPRFHRLTGQLALFVLMVGYTFTGLWLLLSA